MNEVQIKLKKKRLQENWIRKRAELILNILGLKNTELSILVTGDEDIRELNRKYRGKDKPTDVLSFPMGEEFGGRLILGDIVISLDTAQRQAEELGDTLESVVEKLLIHGIVHLLGYNHEIGGEEEERFRKLEESISAELRKG